MVNLNNIQDGDIGLVKSNFEWSNIDTYISLIVNFFINIKWFFLDRKKMCPINHSGTFVHDGEGALWFYEAVSNGYQKTKANERFNDCVLYVKRYELNSSIDVLKLHESMIGLWYNYLGLFVFQFIRMITFDIIDIEQVKQDNGWVVNIYNKIMNRKYPFLFGYCSQVASYSVWISTDKKDCQDWISKDPDDIWNDTASVFVNID